MKILVISAAFYPMISPRSFRTTELVKELCRQGHQVTIMTHYHKNQEPLIHEFGFRLIDLGKMKMPIGTDGNRLVSIVKRIFRRLALQLFDYPYITLMFQVKRLLSNHKESYDKLISIAVPFPIHWGVAWARSTKRPIAKTWIADCGDPYMGDTTDSMKKIFYFKYVEKWFCQKTDFITIPIKEAKTAYYQEFRNKIRVISQGFKFSDTTKLLKPYSVNPKPTFAYAGSIIPGLRDIRPILDFMISLNVPFKAYVFTTGKQFVQPYIDAGADIVLSEYIPRNELIPILSEMDFLLNIENGVSEHLPSKLIDYFLTNRPVLSINSSDINKRSIQQFFDRNYQQRYNFQNTDQYQIESVVAKFIALGE